jgi:hypothetical protein
MAPCGWFVILLYYVKIIIQMCKPKKKLKLKDIISDFTEDDFERYRIL